MTLNGTLDLVRRFRAGDAATPIVLMGYLNPILAPASKPSPRDAAEAGVDGLIVVDCPPEEADPLADALDAAGVALIRLATPTTDDERLPTVIRRTSGFVYYVVGGRRHRGEGGRRRGGGARRSSGCARPRACRSRSASASARPSRPRRSPGWPTRWSSARRWSTRSPPAPSHRTVIRSQRFWKPPRAWLRLCASRASDQAACKARHGFGRRQAQQADPQAGAAGRPRTRRLAGQDRARRAQAGRPSARRPKTSGSSAPTPGR